MDEVAENSDELMERYLEGEEISHEEMVTALKKGVTEGHLFPVTCGIATKNLGTSRLLEALVEDLPSPAMRGRGRGARRRRGGGRGRARPGRRADRLRLQDAPPTPTPGASTCCASTRASCARTPRPSNATRGAKERIGQLAAPHGKEHRARRRARRRATSAPSPSCKETRAGDVLGGQGRRQSRFPRARAAGAGDGVRLRAEDQGRRGEGGNGDAAPRGGGPDARRPSRPRRPASRSSPGSPRSTSR